MKLLLLIVLLLLANTATAAEPKSADRRYTTAELDAMEKEAETQGLSAQEEFEFRLRMEREMKKAEQSRNAAEKQRAQYAKDNYACLLEYRTSAPVIQAPSGSDIGAVGMEGMFEEKREARYVRACMESKGWTFPARNAESTK